MEPFVALSTNLGSLWINPAHIMALFPSTTSNKMKTKLEILNETAAFYSEDPSQRAQDPATTACFYHTEDGRQCAVGRCLKKPDIFSNVVANAYSLFLDFGWEILRSDCQIQDFNFWMHLQRFHDNNRNWTATGLSEEGLAFLNHLRTLYS